MFAPYLDTDTMVFRTMDATNNPEILFLHLFSLFQFLPLLLLLSLLLFLLQLRLLPLLSLLLLSSLLFLPVSRVTNTKFGSDFYDTPLHMRVLSCRRNHPV
ncbi:hypothetical protein AR158_c053R [Paramecium bursaria Chlorella virus AR158]|uniref:hypothetical protein n=1 Tax=Paramecium bursaria Chlorella virus AR158 TaxID=380598 RepID=UPI00015AA76C|nr:hypothetical protein AR158_c053R [Paramecium bursaria Chlorella virus AR158]ABU43599.1 hypothetical protein AR158_c053R [Paramecium bursaria Chlorella virus AR158]